MSDGSDERVRRPVDGHPEQPLRRGVRGWTLRQEHHGWPTAWAIGVAHGDRTAERQQADSHRRAARRQ
jgi:hypothetical protein